MTKHTIVESGQALENAAVMLDACRTEYARAGHQGIANTLRGLDVTSSQSAHIALITVRSIEATDAELDAVRKATIQALAHAVNTYRCPLRMAS